MLPSLGTDWPAPRSGLPSVQSLEKSTCELSCSPGCGALFEPPGLTTAGFTQRASEARTPHPRAGRLGNQPRTEGLHRQGGTLMTLPTGQGRGERGALQRADPPRQEPQADRGRVVGRGKPSLQVRWARSAAEQGPKLPHTPAQSPGKEDSGRLREREKGSASRGHRRDGSGPAGAHVESSSPMWLPGGIGPATYQT